MEAKIISSRLNALFSVIDEKQVEDILKNRLTLSLKKNVKTITDNGSNLKGLL